MVFCMEVADAAEEVCMCVCFILILFVSVYVYVWVFFLVFVRVKNADLITTHGSHRDTLTSVFMFS